MQFAKIKKKFGIIRIIRLFVYVSVRTMYILG